LCFNYKEITESKNEDGLIHISELSHRYVADPRKALGVGDPVKVRVTGIDPKTKRISLSRKAMMPRPQPRPKPRAKAPERPPEPKPVDAEDRERRRAPKPVRKPARHRKPDDSPPSPPLSMEEKIRRLQEKFRGPGR
jgi:predicted RNA-binding protein with RPS1 domain